MSNISTGERSGMDKQDGAMRRCGLSKKSDRKTGAQNAEGLCFGKIANSFIMRKEEKSYIGRGGVQRKRKEQEWYMPSKGNFKKERTVMFNRHLLYQAVCSNPASVT